MLKNEIMLGRIKRYVFYLLIGLMLIGLLGCATTRAFKRGEAAARRKDWDSAVLYYSKAHNLDPKNIKYRLALETARRMASHQHLTRATKMLEQENYEQAILEFRLAVDIDPQNQFAAFELVQARKQIQKMAEEQREKSRIEKLKEKAEKELPIKGYLFAQSVEKINLNFPNKSVKEIYGYLGELAKVNILFDPAVQDKRIDFKVSNLTFMEALEALAQSNQHFYKILNETTIIIVPNTPAKLRQYEEQIIKSYFLSNADAKDVTTQIRALLGIRNVAQNLQLNSITLRDAAAKIALADKIIERLDKSRAEVIVDLEILEVNRSKLNEIGIMLSNYSIIQTLNQQEQGMPLHRIPYLTQADWFLAIPSFIYNFLKQDSSTRLLAKPQLRISEGEKSKLFIGESVPIRVTTFNPTQTVGGNVVPIDSYQYRDVGIDIEITPRVHHDDSITLQLSVKIDAIAGGTAAGQPIFTSRTVETKIRLENGETNLLAGLIKTEKREAITGVPGLSSIPILGRIFSNTRSERTETDLVVTMTPHILRVSEISQEDLMEIWAGTETQLAFRELPPTRALGPESISKEEREPDKEVPSRESRPPQPELSEEEQKAAEEEREESPPPEALVFPEPAASALFRDEEFSLSIQISQAENVGQIAFELSYDPKILEGIETQAGDFMQQDGINIAFEREIRQEEGLVRIRIGRLGSEAGAAGEGTLVIVRFRALSAGISPLAFSAVEAYDQESKPIAITISNGRVEVR